MSCTPEKTIPPLNCTPQLSIKRLDINLSGVLDTTDLATVYGFTNDDVELEWEPTVTTVAGEEVSQTEDSCIVGGSVVSDDDTFISYYNDAAKTRGWVGELPCNTATEGSETPAALQGVVNFSNRRSGSFGLPTFVPRAGTGKREDDSTEQVCGPDSVRVPVYNATTGTIPNYAPIVILGLIDAESGAYGCMEWSADSKTLPWGVLLPVYDEEGEEQPGLRPKQSSGTSDQGYIGCCVLQGVVNIPSKYITEAENGSIPEDSPIRISPVRGIDGYSDSVYYTKAATGRGSLLTTVNGQSIILLEQEQRSACLGGFCFGRYEGVVDGMHVVTLLETNCDGTFTPVGNTQIPVE